MLCKQLSLLTLILGLATFTVATSNAADASNAAEGATLYKASCASCHSDMPGKMIGVPAADLCSKLVAFKAKTGLTGKALSMQKTVAPMTTPQLMSIGMYLESLKK